MPAKEPSLCDSSSTGSEGERPLLMVDIDGVISLFGGDRAGIGGGIDSSLRPDGVFHSRPNGSFHTIDGIPHFLSRSAAAHLLSLAEHFDLVWCSGWEEKAEEYLPHLLGLPAGLPFLRFGRSQGAGNSLGGHWKLDAIDAHGGSRALAWIDDAFDDSCHAWAAARPAPTLLVLTDPADGLTSHEVSLLESWAHERAPARA
jgi:hypothetical protein